MNKMTHDEMLKYSAELVVKNNSDEAVKLLVQLQKENEELKKCNKESITFLNQDDIRDILIQKDHNIFNLQQRIDKAIDTLTFSEKLKNDEIIPFLYQKIKETKSILRGEDNDI